MWLCNTTRAKSRWWITMKFYNKHSSVNWWWRNTAVIFKKTEIIDWWDFGEIKIVFHSCADFYSFVRDTCPKKLQTSLWSQQLSKTKERFTFSVAMSLRQDISLVQHSAGQNSLFPSITILITEQNHTWIQSRKRNGENQSSK